MNVAEIILTRCQIFHLKCTKFNFGWVCAPDPALGAHSAPQALYLDLGNGKIKEEGKERGNRGNEGEGEGGRGKVDVGEGGEGRGKGKEMRG